MIAEILSTGDELRSGAVQDTNSGYIARKLEERGIFTTRHQCVGDDSDMLISVLKEIGGRADIAIVSGGLGPTEDDLTAAAAARAAGVELALDQMAHESVMQFFKSRKRPMNPTNQKQALLPLGAECLSNPVGTAPGFKLKIDRCRFWFVPGVPLEMKRMLNETVLSQIAELPGRERSHYQTRTLATFGLPESATGEMLAGFEGRFAGIKLGLRAKFPEIHIKLYGQGKDEEDLSKRMQQATAWVLEKLGRNVFSTRGESIASVVGQQLITQNATVAVAESCTGGLISHWLTDVPGSSQYFRYTAITYSNEAKIKMLAVSPSTIRDNGAVHEKTALEMVEGVKNQSGADYAIATSGIAGPEGGTEDKPVGTVCIGLATPRYTKAKRYYLQFADRSMNKKIFAMTALDILRRALLESGF
ncbi:MAG: competence/damage-inducible protein A [Deltaproteobacteria bacterium]|nr:competence/damage-inducible protein A [Deltaproteobacteria bacterium]